jgi:endogenous inhibitor of DNA gyrase (YacG/DUF329 family)
VSAANANARCPGCGKPASAGADNPWRPFCSERCKMADLGAWFTDRFRIPSEDPEPRDEPEDKPM